MPSYAGVDNPGMLRSGARAGSIIVWIGGPITNGGGASTGSKRMSSIASRDLGLSEKNYASANATVSNGLVTRCYAARDDTSYDHAQVAYVVLAGGLQDPISALSSVIYKSKDAVNECHKAFPSARIVWAASPGSIAGMSDEKLADTVTVTAKAPAGWRYDPSEKQYTVEGLTAWVLSTDQLSGDNLNAIHSNTERLIREDWDDIVSSSLAQDLTYTPYRMYLFISDEKKSYEYSVLYDTYQVKVTRADGSVFTGYEACRYTDLKIPADGVLTAGYGSLQGFNFGYTQGFSYAQSFSGWTDAAEMEADLRHVRDGYHLAD